MEEAAVSVKKAHEERCCDNGVFTPGEFSGTPPWAARLFSKSRLPLKRVIACLFKADAEHTVSPDVSGSSTPTRGKFYRIQPFAAPLAVAYMRVAVP